jgi:hypothetical protein
MKKQKLTFFDIFFDILFLVTCLLVNASYWISNHFLKGWVFGMFAVLTIWSLIKSPRIGAPSTKFELYMYLRMIRILVGGFLLVFISWDEILSTPFTGAVIIILWLGISWHAYSRHASIRSHTKRVISTAQERKSTLPGQIFTAADLTPGKTYCVTAEFVDYTGVIHPVGECWQFTEKHFLPYDDGLTLVTKKDGRDFLIQLQWRKETQGDIIDNFFSHVQEAEKQSN